MTITLRAMMLIIVVMTLCQEIVQLPVDYLFNNVIRAPLSADVVEGRFVGLMNQIMAEEVV